MFQILDCTCRDGGYYNNWGFSTKFISRYLSLSSALDVDVVEIGFRFSSPNPNFGATAFSSEEFLNLGVFSESPPLAVMLNVSEFLGDYNEVKNRILRIFPASSKDSRIDIVRLALRFDELAKALLIASILGDLGFDVFLNLMQCTDIEQNALKQAFQSINAADHIKTIYVADSFGSMKPSEAGDLAKLISDNCGKPFGLHAHDNMGFARANASVFVEEGASWIDSTMLGMGRGPGNVKTEELLLDRGLDAEKYQAFESYVEFVQENLGSLQKTYRWGYSPGYHMSGDKKIHPTFLQQLLSDRSINLVQIFETLDRLEVRPSKSYSRALLDEITSPIKRVGSTKAKAAIKDLSISGAVILVGNGKSARENEALIDALSGRLLAPIFAVGMNTLRQDIAFDVCFSDSLIKARGLYDGTDPLTAAAPALVINREGISDPESCEFDYVFSSELWKVENLESRHDRHLGLALEFLSHEKPKKIILAGFDGSTDDYLYRDIAVLVEYCRKNPEVVVTSLFPTHLPIAVTRSL